MMNLLSNRRLKINPEGNLCWNGIDLYKLAKRITTPSHIINEQILRDNARFFISTLRRYYSNCDFFFSFKTNCIPKLIRILQEEGFGAEVVSEYELWLALKLGFSGDRIIVNGIGKTPEMIRTAVINNVRTIGIDSLHEIDILSNICKREKKNVSAILRINVGFNCWVIPSLRNQFGIDGKQIFKAVDKIYNSDYLIVEGIHFHSGSNIYSLNAYKKNITKALSYLTLLKDKIKGVPILDIGGGFPGLNTRGFNMWEFFLLEFFPYEPCGKLRGEDYLQNYLCNLISYVKNKVKKFGFDKLHLFVEPGRVITESSQLMLTQVRDVKLNNNIHFAITDSGAFSNAFCAKYEFHNIYRVNNPVLTGPVKSYCLTGRLCTPGDILYRKKTLPELKLGDILAMMDTGAYFTSFANNFSFPKPSIYLIKLKDQEIIPLKEEKFGDIIKSDLIN